MAKLASSNSGQMQKSRPAIRPEARENQLISKAYDLAEKQLSDGTASAPVIAHFLKLGTTRAELEKEKLRIENRKTEAQIKSLQNAEEMDKKIEKVLKAMRNYQGYGDPDEYDD
jgi:DNA replication protein DnaD